MKKRNKKITPKEMTKKYHQFLHESLDRLVAEFITQTHRFPSRTSVLELMEWSKKQTETPDAFEKLPREED